MLDMIRYPVILNDCTSAKIRENFISVRDGEAPTNAIEFNAKLDLKYQTRYFEIVGNYIGSYVTNSAYLGHGIFLNAVSSYIGYGIICDNIIKRMDKCILLNGTGSNSEFSVRRVKIYNNSCSESNYFLATNVNVWGCDIENNFAEINVTNFIQNLGSNNVIQNNRWGDKKTKNQGKILASGDGTTKIFSAPHNLIATAYWGMVSMGGAALDLLGYGVSYDATNIYVTFNTAPPAGTNVIINWTASI